MSDPRLLQYTSVPEYESWIIPFWDAGDEWEYGDLLDSICLAGPNRFTEALETLGDAMAPTKIYGVEFSVGTDLPEGTTVILSPDTQQQAIDILTEIAEFIGHGGVVRWDRIRDQLIAIRDVLLDEKTGETPSIGLGIIIDGYAPGSCTVAPTSWISAQLDVETPRYEQPDEVQGFIYR